MMIATRARALPFMPFYSQRTHAHAPLPQHNNFSSFSRFVRCFDGVVRGGSADGRRARANTAANSESVLRRPRTPRNATYAARLFKQTAHIVHYAFLS